MLVAKPHKQGAVHALDGSDKSVEVQDLTALPGTEDIHRSVDDRPFNNPDGAAGTIGVPAKFTQIQSPGNLRSSNESGKGTIHPSGKTTAPMRNPFPAPKNSAY